VLRHAADRTDPATYATDLGGFVLTGKQNRGMLIAIILLTVFAAFVSLTSRVYHFKLFDLDTRPRLGLDIQGGVRVVLRPKIEEYKGQGGWTPDKLETVRKILENRVNFSGVSEPLIITKPETNQIIIELPGLKNEKEAIQSLQSTASLEFYLLPQLGDKDGNRPAIWSIAKSTDPKTGAEQDVLIDAQTKLPISPEQLQAQVFDNKNLLVATGEELLPNSRAVPQPTTGSPEIEFELNSKGASSFEEATRANVGKFLAIFLDKHLLTAPTINGVIPGGKGVIEGNFTLESAKALSDQLNAGALPVPLELQETRKLEATLGAEAVHVTEIAGAVGLSLVLLFMLFWYRLPGLLADVALVLYTLFSLALFKLYPVTLTLPGIAGFILSIGMAVDANILIFERLKEELKSGKTLRAAIDAGFKRAFTAILDSNVCTVMTCCVLYYYGSGPIRGFALTLGLGVAVSMFTAITVTRTFLFALVNLGFAQKPEVYGLNNREYRVHTMQRKWLWLGISGGVIVVGAIFWAMGGIKRGIDFTGGTELTIPYATRHSAIDIQNQLTRLNPRYKNSRVVVSEDPTAVIKHLASVTTPELKPEEREQVISALTNNGKDLAPGQTLNSVAYANVSGTISKELTSDAFWAVIYASVLITLYLAFRFAIGGFKEGLKYGACAVIALLHDVLVVFGIFALLGYFFNWQVDSLFVTAMLTVIGFSVHDTIIVFDRIRENLQHRQKGETYSDLADRSIDQTISRSLKTSFTVVLTLLALFFFGSSVIHQFSAALLFGIISGTYSSIFNATVLLVMWKQRDNLATVSASPGTSVSARSGITVPGEKPLVTPRPQAETGLRVGTAAADTGGATEKPAAAPRPQRKQPVRRRRM
jgi:SecD/SecF fusion protein